jgi:hypothetical protein
MRHAWAMRFIAVENLGHLADISIQRDNQRSTRP